MATVNVHYAQMEVLIYHYNVFVKKHSVSLVQIKHEIVEMWMFLCLTI